MTLPLAAGDGYVDTGDLVELTDGRYYFRGRKGGIINVGGLKVYPEEVESVLNADPRVRMSLVKARRNPLTGSLVVAEVVLSDGEKSIDAETAEQVKNDLLNACRRTLAAHKVPALLRFVPALELSAAGKLVRPSAKRHRHRRQPGLRASDEPHVGEFRLSRHCGRPQLGPGTHRGGRPRGTGSPWRNRIQRVRPI